MPDLDPILPSNRPAEGKLAFGSDGKDESVLVSCRYLEPLG